MIKHTYPLVSNASIAIPIGTAASPQQPFQSRERIRVLMSAYSFRPNAGSEPGVGWNWAVQASKSHEVWVIAGSRYKAEIEEELDKHPISNLHVVCHDVPIWARWLVAKPGPKPLQTYIHLFLWQWTAIQLARRLHESVQFDLVHHVTFASIRNWSRLAELGIPFIWGPVGGGEKTPAGMAKQAPASIRIRETLRSAINVLVKADPMVRRTCRSAALVLTTTKETASSLPASCHHRVQIVQNIGLDSADINFPAIHRQERSGTFRLLYVGRILYWKGIDLVLESMASLPHTSLTIVGSGPDQKRLERIASRLNIADRVHFSGPLKRSELLALLPDFDTFVFPSLHDSGGFAVLEAMAARLPVICLNLGGPALSVTSECGIVVDATDRTAAIAGITEAIEMLMHDPERRMAMGKAGRQRIIDHYLWEHTGAKIEAMYSTLLTPQARPDPGQIGLELAG